MHAVHNAGSAVRGLEPAHVLMTDKHTVRLSCAGVVDILRPTRHAPLQQLQAEDLQALGALLLCIACRSATAASGAVVSKSMAFVGATFSADLSHLLHLLFASPQEIPRRYSGDVGEM